MEIKERFWSKTEVSTEHSCKGTPCIDWTGSKHKSGYGRIMFESRQWLAHRMSYVLSHGDISDGLCVCHHCDRPCCVNSEHLFLGTRSDNHADMVMKGRERGGSSRGTANAAARLSEPDVVLIKKFLKRYPPVCGRGGSNNFLKRWFGVSASRISAISTGKNWKHIQIEGAK